MVPLVDKCHSFPPWNRTGLSWLAKADLISSYCLFSFRLSLCFDEFKLNGFDGLTMMIAAISFW